MEKRMLLAIVLSIVILVTYQYFFVPPAPQAPVTDGQTVEKAGTAAEPPVSGIGTPAVTEPPAVTAEKQAPEKVVTVESDLYTAVFTSRGGTPRSVELKKSMDKDGKPIVLKSDDVLPPLSIGVDEGFGFSKAHFSVAGRDIKLGPSAGSASLVFEHSSGEYSIRRTYTFRNDRYGFDLKDEFRGAGAYWITLGKDFGIYEKDASVHFGPVILKDAERMEFQAANLKETKSLREGVRWIAQEDKYFFSSIVPKGGVEEAKVWSRNGDSVTALRMTGGVNNYFVYAGPKEYDTLKGLGSGLEHIVDFGFFSVIAMPLFWVLKLFYRLTGNYGIAILVLTVLVRIPFIPLINKSQASMKKLQDIQPRMAELREKYKSDPQRMQKETMELYKKHKVNPMGGCLPMLLQIPVFFALYKVLLIAIELRGAPFMLWIKDLSAPDTLFGQIPAAIPLIGGYAVGPLPLLMGATMVIQQKMTPSAMDPTQQKIMMLMPVLFTVMFLNFASGLVMYWLLNNVLSIGQQYYVNKKAEKQPA